MRWEFRRWDVSHHHIIPQCVGFELGVACGWPNLRNTCFYALVGEWRLIGSRYAHRMSAHCLIDISSLSCKTMSSTMFLLCCWVMDGKVSVSCGSAKRRVRERLIITWYGWLASSFPSLAACLFEELSTHLGGYSFTAINSISLLVGNHFLSLSLVSILSIFSVLFVCISVR
jgi:hypothetical protein